MNNAVGAAAMSGADFTRAESRCRAGGDRRSCNYRTDTIMNAVRECAGISALNVQALGVVNDPASRSAQSSAVMQCKYGGVEERVLGIVQNVGDSHWIAFRRVKLADRNLWQKVDSMIKRKDGNFDTADDGELRQHMLRNMDASSREDSVPNSIVIFAGDAAGGRAMAANRKWRRSQHRRAGTGRPRW